MSEVDRAEIQKAEPRHEYREAGPPGMLLDVHDLIKANGTLQLALWLDTFPLSLFTETSDSLFPV